MPRRNTFTKNVRNIQNSNGTYYVTLPIDEVRALGWKERQKVVVKRDGRALKISDWKK